MQPNRCDKETVMQARMKNPAMIVPNAMQALHALGASAEKGGVPSRTLGLVQLRASQINGCSLCVDMHPRMLKQAGETDERLFALAAWRDAPYFTDAERAALALTEAVTRISDRADPVPDEQPPQRRDQAGGGVRPPLTGTGVVRRRTRDRNEIEIFPGGLLWCPTRDTREPPACDES